MEGIGSVMEIGGWSEVSWRCCVSFLVIEGVVGRVVFMEMMEVEINFFYMRFRLVIVVM